MIEVVVVYQLHQRRAGGKWQAYVEIHPAVQDQSDGGNDSVDQTHGRERIHTGEHWSVCLSMTVVVVRWYKKDQVNVECVSFQIYRKDEAAVLHSLREKIMGIVHQRTAESHPTFICFFDTMKELSVRPGKKKNY